ncbi:NUDIX domain-containing protein [Candidatus Dojkabacteria bacterium]|nr:NUDIX domain-containing protein [Candidatus Dojkabacteria bacterium]
MKLELQPKVSVVCFAERQNSQTGEREILLSKRLKHPNYGKVVGVGGKVRFGETFEEAARRELHEETGLTGTFEMTGILRKIGHQKNECSGQEIVLDILFILFHVTHTSGELIEKINDQQNIWCKLDEIPNRKDITSTVPLFLKHGLSGTIENFEHVVEMEGF